MNRDSKIVRIQIITVTATDELRNEQGKFFVLQCQQDREKQLIDKRKAIDQ